MQSSCSLVRFLAIFKYILDKPNSAFPLTRKKVVQFLKLNSKLICAITHLSRLVAKCHQIPGSQFRGREGEREGRRPMMAADSSLVSTNFTLRHRPAVINVLSLPANYHHYRRRTAICYENEIVKSDIYCQPCLCFFYHDENLQSKC